VLSAVFILPVGAAAQETVSNVGFLSRPIWYSKSPFFAGETVRIYTIVYNSGKDDLLGTVEFKNGDTVLGAKDFSVSGGGKTQHVWIDWTAEEGEHTISADIVNARISPVGGTEEKVSLAERRVSAERVFVDVDTDGDGIGNREDEDDDGDGIPDTEDIAPLDKTVGAAAEQTGNRESVVSKIENYIPDVEIPQSVASGARGLAVETEKIRKRAATYADEKKRESREAIFPGHASSERKPLNAGRAESEKGKDESGTDNPSVGKKEPPNSIPFTEDPLSYMKYFLWALAFFVLDIKILFYAVLAYLFWKAAAIAWRALHAVFR